MITVWWRQAFLRLPGRNIILCRAREKWREIRRSPWKESVISSTKTEEWSGRQKFLPARKRGRPSRIMPCFLRESLINGGTSLTEGADSSGFTQSVLAHFGIAVPRLSAGQLTGTSLYGGTYATPKKISVSELQPGDLVFYGNPVNHAAIYMGNGTIIHAFNEERGIIRTAYDYRTITGCARYW